MFQLICLELRKNKIKSYIWASICIFIFGFAFCFLTAYIPQLGKMNSNISVSPDISILSEWTVLISLISTLMLSSFAIMSAAMHARFTVKEFAGKYAILLFSYPIKRSKILFAKCSLVFCFTAIIMAVCNIGAITLFGVISNVFNILPKQFTIQMMFLLLKTTAITSLLSAAIGLVALRIGVWKKSLVATIVTSVILILPFGNLVSYFPDSSLQIMMGILIILLVIGILIFFNLLSKVNKMEVL